MALPHAVHGQVIDVGPLGGRLTRERSSAVFKSKDLEVLRVVLTAGRALPPPKVPGEVTIQCIEGSFDVTLATGPVRLSPGQLVLLAPNEMHGVSATTDCSALVTIALVRTAR